jgi:alkaline phosphatase D
MKINYCFFILLIISTFLSGQVQRGPIIGAVTENSAVALVKTYSPDQEVIIELFTQEDLDKSIYSLPIISRKENYNYVKIGINNLNPNTTYYYRAIIDKFPSYKWSSFQTFPQDKNYNFSFGFGSCQRNVPDPKIFPVLGNDTLRFFFQLGDWTYPDTTEKKYGYQFNEKMDLIEKSYQAKYSNNHPFVSEVLSQIPIVYTYDDHDFAANDSHGNVAAKENSIWAYKTFFPHYELKNPDNGIWQSFTFGDVEFFVLDLRAQRNPGENAFDKQREFNPPLGHSILAGYDISGVDQKEWFLNSLKNSTAKWKVIVSSVLFNPAYGRINEVDSITENLKSSSVDKWAGYPEDINALLNTINSNHVKNVFIISGDTHSSFIDDGENSIIPEIGASNLDIRNSKRGEELKKFGINIWNRGTYVEDGYTYGKVSFFFEDEEYALLEIVNERKEVIISYKLAAE